MWRLQRHASIRNDDQAGLCRDGLQIAATAVTSFIAISLSTTLSLSAGMAAWAPLASSMVAAELATPYFIAAKLAPERVINEETLPPGGRAFLINVWACRVAHLRYHSTHGSLHDAR